jgi:probable 2-oxoglutarate dehydrogenase E1 component DHKTD1
VDSVRTHGHRAARIDPLDFIEREEVAALSPARYGLTDPEKKYNVNGILWTPAVEDVEDKRAAGTDKEEWWTLRQIESHLRRLYVSNIGYEVGIQHFECILEV